jgi:hypothetical protein
VTPPEIIRVEPALDRRECFARWAVAQTPKVRTADHNAFAVPAALFPEAPEGILIGAFVDGRPYVPVQDDEQPDGGDGDGLTWVEPGQPLPPVPESAYGPDAVSLGFAPLDDAPPSDDDEARDGRDPGPEEPANPDDSDRSDSSGEDRAPADGYPCDVCDRTFTTARGRRTHRRQTHNRRS